MKSSSSLPRFVRRASLGIVALALAVGSSAHVIERAVRPVQAGPQDQPTTKPDRTYHLSGVARSDKEECRRFLFARVIETSAKVFDLWQATYEDAVKKSYVDMRMVGNGSPGDKEAYEARNGEWMALMEAQGEFKTKAKRYNDDLERRVRLFTKGLDDLAVGWSADYAYTKPTDDDSPSMIESNATHMGVRLGTFLPTGGTDALKDGQASTDSLNPLALPAIPHPLVPNQPWTAEMSGAFGFVGTFSLRASNKTSCETRGGMPRVSHPGSSPLGEGGVGVEDLGFC